MTKFWQALEDAPIVMEVAGTWRERLGTEFESLQRFFVATNQITSSIRFPGDRTNWRVIDEGHRIVAVNDELYEHKFIDRQLALLHRIDVRTLSREICDAFGWHYSFEMIGSTYHLCRMGKLPASMSALPVYFCIRKYPSDVVNEIHEAAKHSSGSFLMIMPTNKPMAANAVDWLERAGGQFMAAEDLVLFELNGTSQSIVASADSKPKLQKMFGLEITEEPRYQFRLVGGKHRFVAFDSPPSVIQESPGCFYIAALLAAPGKIFRAIDLEAMWTGINAVVSTGSLGTKIDVEAKREYESKLRILVEEIEEISHLGSAERMEELIGERDAILDSLRSATQRGNELREDSDANRARNSVGAAIRRSMKVIASEHPQLAEHLTVSLSLGLELAYSPPRSLDWYF